ncbi:hypothetical protein O3597_22035 [Verrucosispora sp. WMMA2044]|uniref:hypothetical protein n=1 Tax=Verrucosispora sp. WMMA2044 TaxID=3016419 RepID=UPI00248BF794|nr:hypothetical protein [Verrucosispora sp. WMMA2044]WBB47786.1 hypothetical protein O3597_22035 [Verrucosispora sp. WMMA2044]
MQPLLIGDRLDELRAALTTTHTAQWRRLYEQCDWYRGQSPPTEHPTASITYFGPAAMNLALAYRLTRQPGYLAEARRWISTAVAFPHWGKAKLPDHDLDAGWLLHGLSLAYSWLRDDLPGDEADALRAKLLLQGERMYDFAVQTEGTWWSSSYWQNHNWICYTGLAAAGYVLDQRRLTGDLLQQWPSRSHSSVPSSSSSWRSTMTCLPAVHADALSLWQYWATVAGSSRCIGSRSMSWRVPQLARYGCASKYRSISLRGSPLKLPHS